MVVRFANLLVSQKKPKQGYHISCFAYRVLLPSQLPSCHSPLPSISPTSLMVRRHISNDLKEMALSMSLQGLSDSDIREYTGISERSLKRLRSTYRATGTVSRKALDTGRPRVLTSVEVKVRRNILRINHKLTVLSFFAIVLSVPPTLPSPSCKLSSGRCSTPRSQYSQLRVPSNGRAIP